MEIKISVCLSADPALLAALQALSLGSAPSTLTGSAAGPVKIETIKKEKPAPVKKESPSIAESTTGSQDTGASSTLEKESPHTLSSLRAIAVPLSKAGHKDAIKAWLKKAGYESIQNLEEKSFTGFYDFLQTLKA